MSDLTSLKGIGDTTAQLFHKIGINSVEELIQNVPRKYNDYSHVLPIRSIKPGPVTIQATISTVTKRYSKKGLHITEALASDLSGSVRIMWFNQPYRAQSLKQGQEYFISGEFAQSYKYLVISNPSCELVSDFPIHTARLVPQYKLTKGLTSSTIRKVTKLALVSEKIVELLPDWLLKKQNLMSRHQAYTQLHFPESLHDLIQARERLGFDELFEMSLASELNRQAIANKESIYVPFNEQEIASFVKSLPYSLTDDQRKVAWQIINDMKSGTPMNRLVQGDVGSGKTVVASIALLNAALHGMQSVVMAPTEILAKQHAKSISDLLPVEFKDRIVNLTGSLHKTQKRIVLDTIRSGKALIIIGTHALIEDHVEFLNLALLIIDEQHRFGVEQRKKLQAKASTMPHVLHLSATPIPRSIALTLFGEMDISTIITMPRNRKIVKTQIVVPEIRETFYKNLQNVVNDKNQIFVVCPIIQENETSARSLSVVHIHKQIKSWLPKSNVAVLHGKMPAQEKNDIMKLFVEGTIDILVSTTVIEVGVDVPNATHMIIEGAENFGLAQLHQLRGRVGRGDKNGFCVLIQTENGNTSKRLQILENESNGFVLAEKDLELRGPGAIYGSLQHGALDLKIANISDTKLIERARESVKEFISRGEKLVQYDELYARISRLRKISNLN